MGCRTGTDLCAFLALAPVAGTIGGPPALEEAILG
jgi:hypothetical protein